MSIFKRKKNENGAIAVMAAFVITALLCITALAIDFGFYYYNSAKLQNAVDAAATAVAANLGSTELSQEEIAKSYLKKNGFDVYGEYADSFHITIEKKGILDTETINDDEYITTGYIKLTVDVDEDAIFANILNLKSLHLRKTAFVKCDANYVAMPRALKYSLFAGTSNGTNANPAMVIRGRTGNVTNFIVSEFEGLINGINSAIVQPIIGIFGGTPNFNDLVHINLSEAITNGDVHSNSNIKIGVQAINASRVKDQDYEGTESNDEAFENISKTNDNEYDDYGQVTYTAVDSIVFNNSNINTGNDSATHVYVQNQQYLEQTQNVLTVLNKMNLSTISSTAELQSKYEEKAREYFDTNSLITESQKNAIINQKDNMTYDDSTKTIALDNQSMLVYDVSQLSANSMLAKAQEQTINGLVAEVENNGLDPLYSNVVNDDGSKRLLFENVADKKNSGGINYGIQIIHKDDEGNNLPTVNVNVTGTQVSRDLGNAGLDVNSSNDATVSAAKFAIARTFQQNLGEDGYIPVPNMKPYFVRQVNKSIRNSTKTKEELGDSEALGSKTVKEAVKKMSNELGDTLESISYNDDTYRGDNFNQLISKNTTPFFTRYKSGKDDSLTDLTGDDRTTFNGVKIYNSDNGLRTANDNVEEFKKNNITPDANGESNYGQGAVKKYFDNNIANSDAATKDKYATNYSADAVQRKRDEIEASFSDAYKDKKNAVNNAIKNDFALPRMIDVFLGDTEVNPNRSYFNNQISDINYLLTSTFTGKYTPIVDTSSHTVTMKDGFYFADGSSTKTFTNIVSNSNTRDMTNKFFTSGNTWQGDKNWLGQWQNQSSYLTGNNASTVIVGDITNARGNIDVGKEGKSNNTLVVTGNLSATSGTLQIRANSIVYVNGNVTIKNLQMEENAKLYVGGKLSIGEMGANVSIPSSCEVRTVDFQFDAENNYSFINDGTMLVYGNFFSWSKVENRGTLKCKGTFEINGATSNQSLNNSGRFYAMSTVTCSHEMAFSGGEFYCISNVYATNSGGTNTLDISGTSTIYVRGVVSSTGTGKHIWLHDGTGSTLSIYGYGSDSDCFANGDRIAQIYNSQADSNVYLAAGINKETSPQAYASKTIYINGSIDLANSGNMYFYGNVHFTNPNFLLSNGGVTYIDGNLYAPNAKITASNEHKLIVAGNYDGKELNAESDSAIWVVGSAQISNVSSSSNDVSHISEIFLGEGSAIKYDGKLDIGGHIYIPTVESVTLTKLQVKDFGHLVYFVKNLTVKDYFYISRNGLMFLQGKLTISNCMITNLGRMYVMGGLDMSQSTAINTNDDIILQDQSKNDPADVFPDVFIGSNDTTTADGLGTLDYKGYYRSRGNVYIENHLNINGYNKDAANYVPNRYEGIIVNSGNTYVSGNINVVKNNYGLYTAAGTSLSCKNLSIGSSIYNIGKLYIYENLDFRNGGEFSDKKETDTANLKKGFSIRNGGKDGVKEAVIYIGGTSNITIGGSFQNYGKYYQNGGMSIQGYYSVSNGNNTVDFAMINQNNAQSYFAGNVYLNSNAFLNATDTIFSCDGDLMYGVCLYNCGKFIVTGNVTTDEKDANKNSKTVNNPAHRDYAKFAIRNGVDYNGAYLNTNAVFYCGGGIKIGTTESAGLGGSVQNWGSMYVKKDLIAYPNADNSRKLVTILAQENTKTFIGGNMFSSEGVAIMCNSIFMVDGNYLSKRITKINIDQDFTDNDQYSKCYVYVGGNMLVNTMGYPLRDHPNASRDFDIYSNSNIYVKGNVYANCRVYMKQNITFVIKGEGTLKDHKHEILNHLKAGPRAALQPILEDKDYDYTFFISQCLDENICSRLYVNGHMFVRDTAKMRDMVKNYIYGDFRCTDYVELGKSLDDDNRDASQASDARYRDPSDSNVEYRYKNAGYMYIDGNYYSQYYNKIYASTTLRVKGEYKTKGYLTLRHDAKIFVGKQLRAGKSIDGGSYSHIYVAGTMKAESSFIKIRDCTTVVIGGNMTAFSYIELGKAGDYTRVIVDKDNDIINEATGFVTEGTEPDYGDDGEKVEGSTGTEGGTDTGAGSEESIKDTETLETAEELASDTSDRAKGGVFYVGKTLASYTSYIKEFAYSSVVVGEYVFTPKYVTLRHNADMWVMPETFNNQTFVKKQYVHSSDGTLLGDIIDKLKEIGFNIQQTFTPKNGSVYTLGQLTLNKNASLMGTYDCIILGKCVLRQDSLVYMGHNFECSADSVSSSLTMDVIKGNEAPVGFDTYGTASASGFTFPVVVYANNEINIVTTMDMKLTYLVANKGDVKLYNVYSKSENAERNAKQLPNSVASYHGNIDYFAMYGKIGALFYAPNGKLDIDGWYNEIWGCGLGDTVDVSAFYFAMHRFTNWRTMDLQIAESGNVYLVSEKEYENAVDNIDDIYMFSPGSSDMSDGAGLFFDLNN